MTARYPLVLNSTTIQEIQSGDSYNLYANTTVNGFNEGTTVSASSPSSTTNFDVATQSVQYYTSNTANNWTLNIRGNASTSLTSLLATNQSISVVLLVTNGSTAYYNSVVQVDGTTTGVTTKWQTGTSPTSGNTNSVDVYNYVITRTSATPTYTVLASQTKFA